MAQVTDTLLAEFQSRVDREQHINSTVGEEAQLLHAFRERKRLELENAELRALLLECKQAFLGYPQAVRRSPLDLLRDLNRATAQERSA